jgi:hypothetical protein
MLAILSNTTRTSKAHSRSRAAVGPTNLTPERPPAHVTGDVGQTAAQLAIKRLGWTADIIHSDYGEDLDCEVYVDGHRTALHFRCQVKSTRTALPIIELHTLHDNIAHQHKDRLPAWTTILESLESQYQVGLKISLQRTDLRRARAAVRAKLSRIAKAIDSKYTLAFVCSPLRFAGSDTLGGFQS